jgi:hypothetical protein
MNRIDRPSRLAPVAGTTFLAVLLAVPVGVRACDMNAVDQELVREQPATPQTVATADQQPIMLASPSPDNDDAAKSSSSGSQNQSNSSGQSSGSSQSTQQR